MVYNFFLSSPFSNQKFSLERTLKTIDYYFSQPPNKTAIFLLTHKEHPVGMLAAMAIEGMFTEGYTAVEQAWWVEPEHRGRHSLALIKVYDQWAVHIGCSTATLSSLISSPKGIDKLYNKMGFTLSEYAYKKEI
jgi:GNAT superfamily N-acetyltransferase